MAQKSYRNYGALKQKLLRYSKTYPCLSKPAALTTLLFDTFIKNNGFLASKDYYGSKVEIQGTNYTQWINELKEARVLVQYKAEGNKGSDFIHFAAGPAIAEYINAEKMNTKELAFKEEVALLADVPSKAEFDALKADAAELKARMCKVEETVAELKIAMEPPDTVEKQNRRKAAAERLTQLTLIKSN